MLRLWRETDATVFLITHALDEAAMLADRIGVMSARPGRLIDIVETGWPRERDSRIVEDAEFGAHHGAPVAHRCAQESHEGDRQEGGGVVKSPRALARSGASSPSWLFWKCFAAAGMIDHVHHAAADPRWRSTCGSSWRPARINGAISKTLSNAATAFVLSIVVRHRRRPSSSTGCRPVREALDPLFATYYAIPVLAFYPLLIILFGLGDAPQIMIGFMLGVMAVIVNTLNGLDRVPRVLLKTARIVQMAPVATACRVTLPYAAPYILTGAKLAVAYSLIGIIGSEFIMSRGGMGFEIALPTTTSTTPPCIR